MKVKDLIKKMDGMKHDEKVLMVANAFGQRATQLVAMRSGKDGTITLGAFKGVLAEMNQWLIAVRAKTNLPVPSNLVANVMDKFKIQNLPS
jgi:hypothetical protein